MCKRGDSVTMFRPVLLGYLDSWLPVCLKFFHSLMSLKSCGDWNTVALISQTCVSDVWVYAVPGQNSSPSRTVSVTLWDLLWNISEWFLQLHCWMVMRTHNLLTVCSRGEQWNQFLWGSGVAGVSEHRTRLSCTSERFSTEWVSRPPVEWLTACD